jgi:hypothetical protein
MWILIFRDIGFSDFIHRPGIKKQTKEKHDVSKRPNRLGFSLTW